MDADDDDDCITLLNLLKSTQNPSQTHSAAFIKKCFFNFNSKIDDTTREHHMNSPFIYTVCVLSHIHKERYNDIKKWKEINLMSSKRYSNNELHTCWLIHGNKWIISFYYCLIPTAVISCVTADVCTCWCFCWISFCEDICGGIEILVCG